MARQEDRTDPARAGRGDHAPDLGARVGEAVDALLARPLAPGLYVVATPIGHLGDISLRALAVLAEADAIYCEDTRVSRKLLDAYGIRRKLETYHEHNAEAERPRILARLAEGARIALISDAGTPLISDPGYKLVREARVAGHAVTSVPGPSAAIAALASSGLPSDRFLFEGFLPPKRAARRSALEALRRIAATLIVFETAKRLAGALADMAEVLGAREAVVARELTKRHEETRGGTLAELARWAGTAPLKGEIVVVIGPPTGPGPVSDADIRAALDRLQREDGLSLRDAVREVADALDVPRKRVYALGLARDPDAGTGQKGER